MAGILYDESGDGGVVGGGSANVGGVFTPDIIYAGVVGSGTAEESLNDPVGGAIGGGHSPFFTIFEDSPSGGASSGGSGHLTISYFYSSDGGEVLTGGVATTSFSIQFDLELQWQTRATIEIDKEFSWNTGLLPLRWYRVQGCCAFPTAAGDGIGEGQPGGCEVIGIQTDDEKCAGALGKQQFIQNLLGSSVADICRQLTESRLNWEICSIKQWSRLADGSLVEPDDQCNVLTEVPFCEIPECINFCLHTTGVTNIGATTYVIESSYSLHSYVGSGVVATGGEALTSLIGGTPTQSFFIYSSDGGEILTGGSSHTSSSWDSGLLTTIAGTTYLENVEAVFGTSLDVPNLQFSTQAIRTNCGSCNAMPSVLYMFHNLSNESVLLNYTKRNGLDLPNPLVMRYSSRLQSWVANFHMTGTSADNLGSIENWRFSFEWACINSFGGDDLGSSSWKFSMLAVRKNEFNGVDFDTRVLIVFPPDQICLTSQNLGFDFSFKLNTTTKFVSNDSDILPSVTLLTDSIGLFKSKFWSKTPNFTIRLSKSNISTAVQRQDIYPIFPQLVGEGATTPFISR